MINERDPKFIAKLLWFMRPLLNGIFRVRTFGTERLGEGPYLLVSNHNIGAPFEILALLDTWEKHYLGHKHVFGLAHSMAFRFPFRSKNLAKIGFIPATYESALETLDAGFSVVVFPGGAYEATRPFSQRRITDFAGRKGWAKIAYRKKATVIPISIVGSHSINPVLFRSRLIPYLLIWPKLLRINWFPISLSQLIYTYLTWLIVNSAAPLWVTVVVCYSVFLHAVMWPIWPAQIKILIGEPIPMSEFSDAKDESEALERIYRRVTDQIQSGMNSI